MKILFADDDRLNALLIKKLFETWGFAADMASDGAQALKMAKTSVYDFYLFDIQMPSIDGRELARLLRGMGITQPIVAMTSVSDAEATFYLSERLFDALIEKPISPAELRRLIEGGNHKPA